MVGREGGGGRIGGRRRREAATVTSQPAAKKARLQSYRMGMMNGVSSMNRDDSCPGTVGLRPA